jgi:hypothetical protein
MKADTNDSVEVLGFRFKYEKGNLPVSLGFEIVDRKSVNQPMVRVYL